MNTAKIVISWDCNLDCSYCCNKDGVLRDTFKSIMLEEIEQSGYEDYEITGGEPLTVSNNYKLRRVLLAIPDDKNVYLYTNGLNLSYAVALFLKKHGVTAINVGYHQIPLDWDTLQIIHRTILPIRLWVKHDEVTDDMAGFDVKTWHLGDCDAITTDRFVLEL